MNNKLINDQIYLQVKDQIRSQVLSQVESQVWSQVRQVEASRLLLFCYMHLVHLQQF